MVAGNLHLLPTRRPRGFRRSSCWKNEWTRAVDDEVTFFGKIFRPPVDDEWTRRRPRLEEKDSDRVAENPESFFCLVHIGPNFSTQMGRR